MKANDDQFYAELPVNKSSLAALLLRVEKFYPVPGDWQVIIMDIKSSTSAVMQGQHENVNLIATGCIVVVLNIAFSENIQVPFFFGGDGATFIVPCSLLDKVMPALLLYKTNTMEDFALDLRVGSVGVRTIYDNGRELKIARFGLSHVFPIPVVLGQGLSYAESLIKAPQYELAGHLAGETPVNMDGMQCRWDRIPPPEDKEEIVTLLVTAREGRSENRVFSRVMTHIDKIYGATAKRQPISVAKLKLKTSFTRLRKEISAGVGRVRLTDLLLRWFTSLLGPFWFRTPKGKRYLDQLVAMSETLVMDGRINTVISGTVRQRRSLEAALIKLEKAGSITYGLHTSDACIMSCYVRDMKDSHIHFVDGAEGGYTRAAMMLKNKIAVRGKPENSSDRDV